MKKLLLLSLAYAFACLAVKAQITITVNDVQLSAYTLITGRYTSSIIQAGSSGANQVWDFSSINPIQFDTIHHNLSSFTPNPLFPNATNGECQSFSFGSNCYYMDISSTGIYQIGLEANYSFPNNNMHVVAEDLPPSGYPLPLNYNQSFTESYVERNVTSNSSSAPYDSTITVYYISSTHTVDGWGTIITPYSTFNALRIRKISSSLDTTYNHTPGVSWSTGSIHPLFSDTSYSWLANGVLEVASIYRNGPEYNYTFMKSNILSIADPSAKEAVWKLFPNPATDNLYIQSNTGIRSVICKNIVGQACAIAMSGSSVDVSKLAQGVYFLTLVDEKGAVQTQKFVKQ